jgi:hypothetical protein
VFFNQDTIHIRQEIRMRARGTGDGLAERRSGGVGREKEEVEEDEEAGARWKQRITEKLNKSFLIKRLSLILGGSL